MLTVTLATTTRSHRNQCGDGNFVTSTARNGAITCEGHRAVFPFAQLSLYGSRSRQRLEVVQAKVQKNEIDLALQQAQVTFAASWRELVSLAGSSQMQPVTLEGELPRSETSLDWTNLAQTMVVPSPEYQAAQMRESQARANIDRQSAHIDGYVLTGALDAVVDQSGDDSLRGLTFRSNSGST